MKLTLNIQWKGWCWCSNTFAMWILLPCDVKNQLIRKDPDAGKDEGRRREQQRTRWLDGITDSMDVSLSKLREMMKDREVSHVVVPGLQRIRHDWATEQKQQSKISISCPTHFLRLVPKQKPRAKHLNIPSILSLQHYEDLIDEGWLPCLKVTM